MPSSASRHYGRLVFYALIAVLLPVAAVALLFARSDSPAHATAQTGPTYDFQLCTITFPPPASGPPSDCADNLTAGANADISTWLGIPNGDYNFGSNVTFTPPNSTTASGDTIPDGAIVGKLRSSATLGLPGAPCGPDGNTVTDFVMLNGSVDYDTTDDDTIIFPFDLEDAGGQGTLEPLRGDIGAGSNAAALNDGIPAHADHYPSYLLKTLDPDRVGDINGDGDEFDTIGGVPENPGASAADLDGTVDAIRPVFRATGSLVVVGTAVILEFLIFEPDAFDDFYGYDRSKGVGGVDNGMHPNPLADFGSNSNMGWPNLTVLQDPTATAAPSSIEDFCTGLDSYTLLWGTTRDNPCTDASPTIDCIGGSTVEIANRNTPIGITDDPGSGGACLGDDEGGCVRYTSGTATNGIAGTGTHLYSAVQVSLRDLDNDGYENGLDTCPFDTNIDASPRTNTGPDSPAGDKLDSACDPVPSGGGSANNNQDADDQVGASTTPWRNANDNCPLDPNDDQKESELTTRLNIAAPLGGTRTDAIGDACDGVVSAGNPDGVGSATVADGHFHAFLTVVPKCIGATDTDTDSWCNATETALGSLTGDDTSTPEHYNVTFPLAISQAGAGQTGGNEGEPFQVCNDGLDNDGDTLIDELDVAGCWPNAITQAAGVDTDGDGWSDVSEDYFGTDPNDACGIDGWPSDIVNGVITPNGTDIQDLTDFITPIRYFGTNVGANPPNDLRHDLQPGPGPFATDINILDITLLVTVTPPMLQGARNFGSVCPFPG